MTIRGALVAAAAVAAGWLAILVGGMFLPGAAPAALVIAPPPDILTRLPHAQLIEAGRFSVTLSGVGAADLYRAGAKLVLPAGLPLCVAPR